MRVNETLSGRMQLFCGHLADHRMVDSPDGPYATAIRNIGRATELNEEQLAELRGRAVMQLQFHGSLLTEQDERTRQRGLLLALSLGTPGQEERIEALDTLLPEEVDNPEFLPTRAARDILLLLDIAERSS